MKNEKPPFEITNPMIHSIAEIAELLGRLTSMDKLSSNPVLLMAMAGSGGCGTPCCSPNGTPPLLGSR